MPKIKSAKKAMRQARARTEDQHREQAAIDSTNAARIARVRYEAGAVDLDDRLALARDLVPELDAVDRRFAFQRPSSTRRASIALHAVSRSVKIGPWGRTSSSG